MKGTVQLIQHVISLLRDQLLDHQIIGIFLQDFLVKEDVPHQHLQLGCFSDVDHQLRVSLLIKVQLQVVAKYDVTEAVAERRVVLLGQLGAVQHKMEKARCALADEMPLG